MKLPASNRVVSTILALALAFLLSLSPARAQAPCSIALVLALDISGSVDWKEYRLQRTGLAKAFRNDSLIDVIEHLPGGIAVAISQWSGTYHQERTIGWHRVNSRADAYRFAAEIDNITRGRVGALTATGNALLHADLLFQSNPYQCEKRVIDISSDGRSNQGLSAARVSDQIERNGTTINVLAILEDDESLVPYFAENIIAGPAAFVQSANDYEDYHEAMRRKLLRELSPNHVKLPNLNPALQIAFSRCGMN